MAGFLWASAAAAQPALPAAISEPQVQVRLIAAVAAVGQEQAVPLGLHVRLEPGWIFYWRTPGEVGIAPQFDWSASRNVATVDVYWPAPQRHLEGNLPVWSYADEVVLPLYATLQRPGRPADVVLSLEYGVCKDVCIPYSHRLALRVPAGAAAPGPAAPLIARFAERVPAPPEAVGVQLERLVAQPTGLAGELTFERALSAPLVAVEGPEAVAFGPAEVRLSAGGRRAALTVPVRRRGPEAGDLAGAPIVLTVIDGDFATEIRAFVGAE